MKASKPKSKDDLVFVGEIVKVDVKAKVTVQVTSKEEIALAQFWLEQCAARG